MSQLQHLSDSLVLIVHLMPHHASALLFSSPASGHSTDTVGARCDDVTNRTMSLDVRDENGWKTKNTITFPLLYYLVENEIETDRLINETVS